MAIIINKQYTTYLGKKYGNNRHAIEDANVFNANGSIREDLKVFSPPGGTLNLGGAWMGWNLVVIATGKNEYSITGYDGGFDSVASYIDADKDNSMIFNFWNPKTESYQPVTLEISLREQLIGTRYFENNPTYGPNYYGASVEAYDLKFHGADRGWAYDVMQGTASYPEEEGRWGDLPKTLTYYTTNSPFVSYKVTPSDDFYNNLHIIPMIKSFVKNMDGKWVGKLGFGVYRKTYGVKTYTIGLDYWSRDDFEKISVVCPDENGPFGNWLIDIGAPELSKLINWYEGSYSVNLNTNVTIE